MTTFKIHELEHSFTQRQNYVKSKAPTNKKVKHMKKIDKNLKCTSFKIARKKQKLFVKKYEKMITKLKLLGCQNCTKAKLV
jgi:hypothetical protein